MLHIKTVDPTLFRILKDLMQIDSFDNLLLVGGTSLALQIGHRESVDIDLFGKLEFEYDNLNTVLTSLGNVITLKKSKNINIFSIDNIKVDFVNYRYPWLKGYVKEDGIRLASKEDIAAMKLNAIVGRGTKKDFIDLYFLLNDFSLREMMQFYNDKYDDGNVFLVKKSLLYFEDADQNQMPRMIKDISWSYIKNTLKEKVHLYLNE